MEYFRFVAMNTDILLAAEGSLETIQDGFERTTKFIRDEERRFTRFSTDSELSHLNQSAGAWFKLSVEMLEVIQIALFFREETGGLFDPTILHDLERIGYDRSLDYIRSRVVSSPASPMPHKPSKAAEIRLRQSESLISLPPGTSLDLGGIAKGWIVEHATRILANYSLACGVSAGGDMYTTGLPSGELGWRVGLEDPLNPGESLVSLKLPPGATATSATTKRVWKQDGKLRHHLIDPRSGEPAESDWLSVTVIAQDLCLCEAYAKALLIAGPREAQKLASQINIDYLAVDRNENILGTSKSLEYIYE
jgi:thiamine biosynthesis lipoprotein